MYPRQLYQRGHVLRAPCYFASTYLHFFATVLEHPHGCLLQGVLLPLN